MEIEYLPGAKTLKCALHQYSKKHKEKMISKLWNPPRKKYLHILAYWFYSRYNLSWCVICSFSLLIAPSDKVLRFCGDVSRDGGAQYTEFRLLTVNYNSIACNTSTRISKANFVKFSILTFFPENFLEDSVVVRLYPVISVTIQV